MHTIAGIGKRKQKRRNGCSMVAVLHASANLDTHAHVRSAVLYHSAHRAILDVVANQLAHRGTVLGRAGAGLLRRAAAATRAGGEQEA